MFKNYDEEERYGLDVLSRATDISEDKKNLILEYHHELFTILEDSFNTERIPGKNIVIFLDASENTVAKIFEDTKTKEVSVGHLNDVYFSDYIDTTSISQDSENKGALHIFETYEEEKKYGLEVLERCTALTELQKQYIKNCFHDINVIGANSFNTESVPDHNVIIYLDGFMDVQLRLHENINTKEISVYYFDNESFQYCTRLSKQVRPMNSFE